MAEAFKIGTVYMPANRKFSSSSFTRKERRMLMLIALVDAAQFSGGARR